MADYLSVSMPSPVFLFLRFINVCSSSVGSEQFIHDFASELKIFTGHVSEIHKVYISCFLLSTTNKLIEITEICKICEYYYFTSK